MSEHANAATIAPGTPVFDALGAALGPVESGDHSAIRVQGRDIPRSAIERVDATGVHLHLARAVLGTGSPEATPAGEDRIVIPLAEERLQVGTREIDLGEIIIRKRVIEEERMVPVVFRREEIEVIRREPGASFPTEDTLPPGTEVTRFPLHGWEPVVGTESVITREAVIEKGQVVETGHVVADVRREHVTVEERYAQARPDLEQTFMAGAGATGRTFTEAEPQYRAGFVAGNDPRYQGRDFTAIESEIQQQHGESAALEGGDWETLRREIRAGFEAARRH